MDLRRIELLETRIRRDFLENGCKGVKETLGEDETRFILQLLQKEISILRLGGK